MPLTEVREAIINRARDGIVRPPYGANLASLSFVLGLLAAAEMIKEATDATQPPAR